MNSIKKKNRLRELREAKKLTLADVGKLTNCSVQSVSNYELGQRALTDYHIRDFCAFYGVTSDYLLCMSDNPKPSMSDSDIAIIQAYHNATPEIQKIIDAALEPYRKDAQKTSAAS